MRQPEIQIIKVESRRQRKQFVRFPWKIYRDDPYWVPPLIRHQLSKLHPSRSPFFQQGEADLFMALKHGKIAGTIVPWMNHRSNAYRKEMSAGFGFFEVIDDQRVASALFDTAIDWARCRHAEEIRGPLFFSPQDSPGVLIKGFDSLPPPLAGHTPPYYSKLLEEYGFEKHRDALAYRVELTPFNNDVENLPRKLLHVARAAQNRYRVVIRTLRLDDWDNELKSAIFIFNEALGYQREGVPMAEDEFIKLASDLRKFIDPELVFVAEVDKRPIGMYVAFPNTNQLLQQLNGHLFPFAWIKLLRASQYMTLVSTKILGVLKGYRNKGIDALLYLKIAEKLLEKGHEWIDYSLVAEENQMANRLVQRLGGTVYKIFRTYKMHVTS